MRATITIAPADLLDGDQICDTDGLAFTYAVGAPWQYEEGTVWVQTSSGIPMRFPAGGCVMVLR